MSISVPTKSCIGYGTARCENDAAPAVRGHYEHRNYCAACQKRLREAQK